MMPNENFVIAMRILFPKTKKSIYEINTEWKLSKVKNEMIG